MTHDTFVYEISLNHHLRSTSNIHRSFWINYKHDKRLRESVRLLLALKKVPNLAQDQRSDERQVKVAMIRIAPRSLDYCNLVAAMKGLQDEIADYILPGLAPGRADGDPRFTFEYLQTKGQPKEYKVIIRIEIKQPYNFGKPLS